MKASEIIKGFYDAAKVYSLRNRDDNPYPIDDLPNVIRGRLNCYAAENLLLSDDTLQLLDTTWDDLKNKIEAWVKAEGKQHPTHDLMADFGITFERQNYKIKGLEVIFLYFLGKSKPWEVVVGQAIAGLNTTSSTAQGS